jgi:hypothetical protein
MKIIHHHIDRKGDHLKITGPAVDRLRRPGKIEVTTVKDVRPGTEGVIIEGDAADVTDTMFALANIAWNMGWRPAGLTEALTGTLRDLKTP